jgi:hypothetical protein
MKIKYVLVLCLLWKYGFLMHGQAYNCQSQECICTKISLLFNSKIYNVVEWNTLWCKNEDSNCDQFR